MAIDSSAMLGILFILHCFADFTLQIQSGMDKFKQKKWWDDQLDNLPLRERKKFNKDYKVGLVLHAFYWSFIVCIPLILLGGRWYMYNAIIHALIHCCIDDLKANKHAISLKVDQALHLLQLMAIWYVWCR